MNVGFQYIPVWNLFSEKEIFLSKNGIDPLFGNLVNLMLGYLVRYCKNCRVLEKKECIINVLVVFLLYRKRFFQCNQR